MSEAIRASEIIHVRFYSFSNATILEPSFTIKDRDVIRELASKFRVSSTFSADVHQVPCGFHIEFSFAKDKGLYILGGSNTIAFYPDYGLDREFVSEHQMAEVDPQFVDVLNEHFGVETLSELTLSSGAEVD